MRRVLILGTVILLTVTSAFAKATNPSDLIKGVTEQAITILQNTQPYSDERKQQLQQLFRTSMDLPFVGRFVMGRYWRTMSPEQKAAYTEAFDRYVLTVYAGRLNEYSGESIQVTESRKVDEQDTIVGSQLMRQNKAPVSLEWRVRQNGGEAKVIDVAVEGVSMALTQRQEFASILQREGVDGLIKQLKNPNPPR
ncbi:MAG: ABC transporter substrate-binding protein [Alphaproteobacteria bacterium]|nr:ABC transporter substrate-binding protein [Alphaproteobacteria bacterium]